MTRTWTMVTIGLLCTLVLCGSYLGIIAYAQQGSTQQWTPVFEAFVYHAKVTPQGTLHWVDMKDIHRLAVAAFSPLQTMPTLGKNYQPKVAINAGFFDPANGLAASYGQPSVWVDGSRSMVATLSPFSPEDNPRLTNNEGLKPYWEAIQNRSELRLLQCPRTALAPEYRASIQRHNDPVSSGCTVDARIGAGPQLLPTLTAEDERFYAQGGKRDPIGVYRSAARSGVGLRPDGTVVIVLGQRTPTAKGQTPGWTLPQFAQAFEDLGATQAMALDGGSSSSLWIQDEAHPKGQWIEGMRDAKGQPVRRPIHSVLWLR
ncbi:MAG: phosphodiester glycosidase family protein [Vampirovibrionales bacterium]|nr:phosphodiester glycosidase family protein [Vampirovibrionales bacterium]